MENYKAVFGEGCWARLVQNAAIGGVSPIHRLCSICVRLTMKGYTSYRFLRHGNPTANNSPLDSREAACRPHVRLTERSFPSAVASDARLGAVY
jgi:hypothetical protein